MLYGIANSMIFLSSLEKEGMVVLLKIAKIHSKQQLISMSSTGSWLKSSNRLENGKF